MEIRDIVRRKLNSKKPMNLTVNILGPHKAAAKVSLALSRINAFLQHPRARDSSIEYYNPDMLVLPGYEPIMKESVSEGTLAWKQDHLSQDIENILGSLGQHIAPELEGDELYPIDGLRSALTKLVLGTVSNNTTASMSILTDIRHQETGARFVLKREDETFSEHLTTRICNVTSAPYPEHKDGRIALGGVIADVMGMGKTLTTLVSILRSSEKALEFVFARPAICPLEGDIIRTKATLVVVPSARKSQELFRDPTNIGSADISDRAFGELGI